MKIINELMFFVVSHISILIYPTVTEGVSKNTKKNPMSIVGSGKAV